MFSKRTNSLEIERIFALPESRRQRSLALQTAAILAFYQPFLIAWGSVSPNALKLLKLVAAAGSTG